METDNNTESLVIWRAKHQLEPSSINQIYSDMDKIDDVVGGSSEGTIKSSFFISDIYQRPELTVVDFYSELTKKIVDDLSLGRSQTSFDYWCQIYDGNHNVHEHYTPEILVSFVHFIKPMGKCFYFLGPAGEKTYPRQDEGDVIAFPSWASHGIDSSYGKERMTIAGNIIFNTINPCGDELHRISKVRNDLFIIEKINGAN